jgi:pimeloyl-ACP methyl ester carboxylesterase
MEAGIFSYKGVMIQHLERFQDRPTIVFLHDSLGCIELWRDFPQKLADAADCNFLVYDRLGYGKSDPAPTNERSNNYMELEADFLNELLTELQLKDVVLFGHSDGGSIALIAAGKYPENIQAVIAEAAHIFVEDITLEGIDYAKSSYESLNMAERLAKYHGDKVDFVFSAWTETWMKPEFRSWNIEHFLPNISCPVLFIQGEDDENRTLEQVNGSAEKLILPEIGHTPHRESPKEVLEKASMFIWDL